MRLAVLLPLLCLAVACGVPSSPAAQADEVHSVAAEGAILAHDAAEGDTRSAFARTHAAALRERLEKLRPEIRDDELARIEQRTTAALTSLEDDPFGADVEGELEAAAQDAEELAR